MIFVRRRLILSASQPEISAPVIAPRSRIATVSCCCACEWRPRSFFMNSIAPPMTPVS